jgi:tetratricopeptide (TPR) repeat protein
MALYALGRPGEARPLLEEARAVEYERQTTLYYLGRCYCELGELDKSKESLLDALALDLDAVYVPNAHYLLGVIHHWQGREAWAIREFEWCLENDNRALVPKQKLLTGLVQSNKALGLDAEAERYATML